MAYHQGLQQNYTGLAGYGCGQGCGCHSCRSRSWDLGQTYEPDEGLGYYGYGYSPWGGYGAPPAACTMDIPPRAPVTAIPFKGDAKHMMCPPGYLGRSDHGAVIAAAVARAIAMLERTIGLLETARANVCSGAPHGLDQLTTWWMTSRLGVCVDQTHVWTDGTFVNLSVAEVIRRLIRVRNVLAKNEILYVCNPAPFCGVTCDKDLWAWVCVATFVDNGDCVNTTSADVIRLCPRFWTPRSNDPQELKDHAEFQAQTLIHEVSHLTHCTRDVRGHSIGVAECLTQLVAITNDSPVECMFANRCAVTTTCGPVVDPPDLKKCSPPPGLSGFGAAPRATKLVAIRTVFHPENAVRLPRHW
jgi:hypothetical protein